MADDRMRVQAESAEAAEEAVEESAGGSAERRWILEGNVWPAIWRLAIPTMFSTFF